MTCRSCGGAAIVLGPTLCADCGEPVEFHPDPALIAEETWREAAGQRMSDSEVGRERGLDPVDCMLLLDEALHDPNPEPRPAWADPATEVDGAGYTAGGTPL